MSIPNWYELILLSLAAWRVFQLIALDDITNGLRRFVTGIPKGGSTVKRRALLLFIECPYCAGFWIALAWWGAFQVYEFGTLVVSVPLAISAGVVAGARLLSSE